MPEATRGPGKWKRWALAMLIAVVPLGLIFSGQSAIDRARRVQIGMTRVEVQRIMGTAQMRYRLAKADGSGIEIGECWDRGGSVRRVIDDWRRNLRLLNSFKTRGQYPVEIQYDGTDRVESVEIRDAR